MQTTQLHTSTCCNRQKDIIRNHWVELAQKQWAPKIWSDVWGETGKLSTSQACKALEWEQGEKFRCADTVTFLGPIPSTRPISTYRRGSALQELEKPAKCIPKNTTTCLETVKVKFTAHLSLQFPSASETKMPIFLQRLKTSKSKRSVNKTLATFPDAFRPARVLNIRLNH